MTARNTFSAIMLAVITVLTVSSCNITRISKRSTAYRWVNKGSDGVDELQTLKPVDDKEIRATITEGTDYLIIKPEYPVASSFQTPVTIGNISLPAGWRTDNTGSLYYPEAIYDSTGNKVHFHYTELKHGLQAMSVLLKFRGNIDQGEVARIPPMVETGSTFAIAYGFKHSWNSYSTDKNFWGKRVSNFTVTAGPMLGGSAVELKAATNAPGLGGDRKSAVISYGAFAMIGTGPINIGYAIGKDHVIGYGASNWVYGGKTWHGLIVGINLITF